MQRTGHHAGTEAGRLGRALAMLVAASAVIAACAAPGAGTSNPPASTPPITAAPATQAPPATNAPTSQAPATQSPAAAALGVGVDSVLGPHVTGAGGLSLYVFEKDSGGKSACTASCASSWPPLTVASASALAAGSGVTGALGTITRDDGSLQVTLGGAPLYYFSGDKAAGDTTGQGLYGLWYLASPSGEVVGEAESTTGAPGPGSSTCCGRYCY